MYKKIVLKNGLRLILVPRKETAVLTALVVFALGSRNEDPEVAGISHVLEHMTYKGAKKRKTAQEVAEFVDSLGGRNNAFTDKEWTGFYVKAPSKHLDSIFDFLSDNICHSSLAEEELVREKAVILEEIKMYNDMPSFQAGELFDEAAFLNQSLGSPVIGFSKSVDNINRQDLVDYHKNFAYKNCVIAIAGNFSLYSEEEITKKIENLFDLNQENKKIFQPVVRADKFIPKILIKKTEQSNLIAGFLGPSMGDDDWYAMRVMTKILGGSMSSRMFLEIREKRGLAYSVSTGYVPLTDIGLIYTEAGVAHHNVKKTLEAILEQYDKIAQTKVDPAELSRAKEMIRGSQLIELEDSEELASTYAFDEVLMNKIEEPDETIRKIELISVEQVQEVARKYLNLNKIIFSAVGEEIDKDNINKILESKNGN
jgi:predicted Zn-dependent peptidase